MKIYSLKGLAREEGVHPDYLRVVIRRYKAEELKQWRGYKFFGIEGKAWFAYEAKQKVNFVDV